MTVFHIQILQTTGHVKYHSRQLRYKHGRERGIKKLNEYIIESWLSLYAWMHLLASVRRSTFTSAGSWPSHQSSLIVMATSWRQIQATRRLRFLLLQRLYLSSLQRVNWTKSWWNDVSSLDIGITSGEKNVRTSLEAWHWDGAHQSVTGSGDPRDKRFITRRGRIWLRDAAHYRAAILQFSCDYSLIIAIIKEILNVYENKLFGI